MRPYNISSTFSKILGLQGVLKSNIAQFRAMSVTSTPAIDHDVNRIVDYWFHGEDIKQKWFSGTPIIDADIKDQFGDLISKARASQLTTWTEKPQSTLALLILLDQFSRNIFRGTPEAFSSDDLALNITTEAIAKGFDRKVKKEQQPFFYMPMMHSETLLGQVAGVAHFELLQTRCDLDSDLWNFVKSSTIFAEKHQNCIIKFGRFPSRNKILGRESTPEEIAYLKEHPGGF